jgi:hypothetical protein
MFSPRATSSACGPAWAGQTTSRAAKDGNFYIAEQEDRDKPARVACDANGTMLARMESRHVHGVGVDRHDDIYAGLTTDRSVDKFVRKRGLRPEGSSTSPRSTTASRPR